MDAIVERFINLGVKATKTIASDPKLTAPEKIFHILMGQKPDTGRKEEMIDQLHQVTNTEMHQKSLVETIRQLTPVITEVIEQGIEEGYFQTAYPKETVEFLLVSSQVLFDEGIFHWESQELQQKSIAFSYVVETTLGAKKGSFSYIAKMLENPANKQIGVDEDGNE